MRPPAAIYTKSFLLSLGNAAPETPVVSLAAYCLQLPGKQLHLSALLAAKKFRGRGNKIAALAAFRTLEEAGLGQFVTQESHRGTAAVSDVFT